MTTSPSSTLGLPAGREGPTAGGPMHPTDAPTPSRASRPLVWLAFGAVYVIWGSTYLAIRFGIETIPPFLLAGTRFLAGGGLFVAWARLSGAPAPEPRHWVAAAALGGLMLVGGIGVVTWAELRVPSGITALLIAMVPLWIVLIDWLRPGGARPHRLVVVGLLMGFAGVALLVNPVEPGDRREIDLTGALAITGATISWAFGSVASRHVRLPDSQVLGIGLQMVAGGVMLLGVAVAAGELAAFDVSGLSVRSALAWAYLVGPGSMAFAAYLFLLRASTPARAATYAYVNPVIALMLGALLAGEALSSRTLGCSVIIVLGVVMIVTAKGRRAVLPR